MIQTGRVQDSWRLINLFYLSASHSTFNGKRVCTFAVSRDYNQRWLLGEQSLIFSIYHIPLLVHFNAVHVLDLIYQTSVHQNSRRALNATHRSVFINLDASVGCHQISRQVSARGRSFKISADLIVAAY